MYGFWIKPDRFVNFQGLYAVYLNQLKALAYKFEDLFTGKTTRFHKAGIDGYIIEAGKAEDVTSYFKAYAMPKAHFVYNKFTDVTETIAANLVPGSVLIMTEDEHYPFVADNGYGVLKKIDGGEVGTIDYTTGECHLEISISEDFRKCVTGYAVVGDNVKSADLATTEKPDGYTVAITGLTAANEIKGGQIPGAQVGLTAQIITVDNLRKFFVGFTTNSLDCQAEILSEIAGKPVTITTQSE